MLYFICYITAREVATLKALIKSKNECLFYLKVASVTR